MKGKIKIGIVLFFLAIVKLSAQSIDKKACKIFMENINEIERFYEDGDGYSVELKTASTFLERITKIKSTTKYTYQGIGDELSESDVHNWKNWYDKNKHLLLWDSELKKVKLKKES